MSAYTGRALDPPWWAQWQWWAETLVFLALLYVALASLVTIAIAVGPLWFQ